MIGTIKTMQKTNEYGQPVSFVVENWQTRPYPARANMTGVYCVLQPLNVASHGSDLCEAFTIDHNKELWTYLPLGPFEAEAEFYVWLEQSSKSRDPLFYAVVDKNTNKALGLASYLRIKPEHGVIEVGYIIFSPLLQKTPLATEAMYLMMRYVFNELGYRRYEWKCDALNEKSCRAAERFGFTHDGIFKQAIVYKGRNRDTAWFSMLDRDWPKVEKAYKAWLSPTNFDAHGRQKKPLSINRLKTRE